MSTPSAAPTTAAAPSAPAAPPLSSPPPSAIASSSSSSATVVAPSQDPIAKRVLLPRCAAWFSLDAISAIERRMLPEFFEHDALHRAQFPPGAKLPSSKTPPIYLKYRNYMVHAYRQQPHVYLTATACRRNLAGDACAIMRVHEFLTHWGIINYDVPPHALPPAPAANYSLKLSAPPTNGPVAVLVTNNKTPTFSNTNNSQCERCGAANVAFELSPDAKKMLAATNATNRSDLPLQAFALRPGSGVCDDCYLARSFPDGVDASDFVRVPTRPQWTPEEDALLMEAVSTSGSEACDWTQVAGKVKSKSADECVVRFLELPLLPQFRDAPRQALAPTFGYAESANAAVVDMAKLVRDVDPFVAKAAARAAIHAIQELHKQRPQVQTAQHHVKREDDTDTGDVEMDMTDTNGDTTTLVAEAVATASDAAGVVVKSEPTTTPTPNGTSDDVDMTNATNTTNSVSNPVSKETVAVVHEASHATAAALLATRAHTIAKDTAEGPVRGLVTQLLQNQLEQMELKLEQVAVLEKALSVEKEILTRERHALYMDRLAFAQLKLHGGGGSTSAMLL